MKTASAFTPAKVLTFTTVQTEYINLKKYIQSLEESEIFIDLQNVELCDSAGLALMLEAKRLANTFNKQCVYSLVPEPVWNLALFCGVESIFSSSVATTNTEH
jgi:phospholipid transport system transporter-binding protein